MRVKKRVSKGAANAEGSDGFSSARGDGDELHQIVPKKGAHDGEAHLIINQGIRVSFGHLKAIGASGGAQPLLDKAGVAPTPASLNSGKLFRKRPCAAFSA